MGHCVHRKKLWYKKSIKRTIKKEQLFLIAEAHEFKANKRILSNKSYFKKIEIPF